MIGAPAITQLAIDLSSPEFTRDPYPLYARLRQAHPLFQMQPEGVYVLSRYEDVFFALTHHELFGEGASSVTEPEWLAHDCRHKAFLISQDPPEHRKVRNAVSKTFADANINAAVPFMRDSAQSLTAQLLRAQQVDFMTAFAFPYVGGIIFRLLGLNLEGHSLDELRRWVELILLNQPQRPPQAHIDAVETAIRDLFRYLDQNIGEHRAHPAADGITDLLEARLDGQPFSDEDLRNALLLLVSAGLESTSQTLASAVLQLLQEPHLITLLRGQPELIPTFIDETMRFAGPTHVLQRITRQPVHLHGVTIPAGALVRLLLASANRDPQQFADPETFDLFRRNNKRHVALGCGPHVCLGGPLARLEIKAALEALLPHLHRISCPEMHRLEWRNTLSTRCLKNLPLLVHPRL